MSVALHAKVSFIAWMCFVNIVAACPTECYCSGRTRVVVYCDFKGLNVMPDNIPIETTHLYLMGNKFTKVIPSMFYGHERFPDGSFSTDKTPLTDLKVIRLDLNPISIVNEHAFRSISSLELIYLPFDVRIQRQAFAQLKMDMVAFEGYSRVDAHPYEDPHFVAFKRN